MLTYIIFCIRHVCMCMYIMYAYVYAYIYSMYIVIYKFGCIHTHECI